MEFYSELCCAMTGADCPAITAWYKLDAAACPATGRAVAHWAKADEKLRDAIAAALGISEPFPNDKQWGDMPMAIRKDYETAMQRAADRLAQ